jgi:starch synthase
MKILIATPEAVPYVKTGGLADVTGALLKEFRSKNGDASLVLPLYRAVRDKFSPVRTGKSFRIKMGGSYLSGEVWVSDAETTPYAYFIGCDELYGRSELYGTADGDYPDNALRFSFFSRAVLETCAAMNINPDVIHCNDWQTGMVPLYLRTIYRDWENFKGTATLFTIHNLGYQGLFPASDIRYTGLEWDYFTPERLEFFGKLNYMKAGLLYSDLINTVSMTYAKEVLEKENGFGLDGVLRMRKEALFGVLNGIDYGDWDPSNDGLLPLQYSEGDLREKARCKRVLEKEAGLDRAGAPLFGFVGRFSSQKGLDLLAESMDELVSCGANLVVLGRGEDYYQDLLMKASGRHPGKVFLRTGFEDNLAHLIYAGSDFFLMPSRYEPCGLGQLIALRYGSVPVARKTGGLADTVADYDHLLSKGTGFLFSDFTPSGFMNAVKRALCVFCDKGRMRKIISEAMKADFSWRKSAEQYVELYKKAVEKARR